ncbi:unnamed protein product [Phytophthora fragariaefolia]|uniref:Unnamed protein product n=1 Tax=Phytophthora fragariaefolia TaxID=1490495 RepID=A0A9W6U1P9_9STRA|nr:unnamed protein product [Phytophthora fragariaefolia]
MLILCVGSGSRERRFSSISGITLILNRAWWMFTTFSRSSSGRKKLGRPLQSACLKHCIGYEKYGVAHVDIERVNNEHALLTDEKTETFLHAIRQFKRCNPRWTEIQCVVGDKDFTEIGVFKAELPHASVLLCQFHAVEYIQERISKADYGLSVIQRNRLKPVVSLIVKATTEAEYDECFRFMRQELGVPDTKGDGNGTSEDTTVPLLELSWQKIKTIVDQNVDIDESVTSLIWWAKVKQKSFTTELARVGQVFDSVHHTNVELTRLAQIVSRYAFNIVKEQFDITSNPDTYYNVRDEGNEYGHRGGFELGDKQVQREERSDRTETREVPLHTDTGTNTGSHKSASIAGVGGPSTRSEPEPDVVVLDDSDEDDVPATVRSERPNPAPIHPWSICRKVLSREWVTKSLALLHGCRSKYFDYKKVVLKDEEIVLKYELGRDTLYPKLTGDYIRAMDIWHKLWATFRWLESTVAWVHTINVHAADPNLIFADAADVNKSDVCSCIQYVNLRDEEELSLLRIAMKRELEDVRVSAAIDVIRCEADARPDSIPTCTFTPQLLAMDSDEDIIAWLKNNRTVKVAKNNILGAVLFDCNHWCALCISL